MRFSVNLLLLIFFSTVSCKSDAYSRSMPPKCSDINTKESLDRIIQASLKTYDNNIYSLDMKQIRTTDINRKLGVYRCLTEVVFYYRDSPSRKQYFEYIVVNENDNSFSVIVFGL